MQNLKDNLPLISAFLLVIGALRLIYYYSYFGIDITSYIDLSEIFILSLSFFINSSAILLFGILFILPMTVLDYRNKVANDANLIKYKKERIAASFALGFVLFILLFFMYFGYLDWTITWDMFIILVVLFFLPALSNFVFPTLKNALLEGFDFELKNIYNITIILAITVISISIFYSRHEARNMIYKKQFIFTEINLDTISIQSSQTYRYVGKTKNFAFFYNTLLKKADVYPIDKTTKISLSDESLFDGVFMKPNLGTNTSTKIKAPKAANPKQLQPKQLQPKQAQAKQTTVPISDGKDKR